MLIDQIHTKIFSSKEYIDLSNFKLHPNAQCAVQTMISEHSVDAIQLCIILSDSQGKSLTAIAGSVYFLHKMSRRLQHTILTEFRKLNILTSNLMKH